MFKQLLIALALTTIFSTPSLSIAKEGHGSDCTSCHKLDEKEATDLLNKIGGSVKSVKQAPVKGFFELLVEKDGKQGIIYLDYSKKNIMQGMVFNLQTLQPLSSHEQPKPKQVTIAPQSIPADKAFVIGNPKGSKKLYVFTDPDCPYCRTFHGELKKLAKIDTDVAIHIMLMPLPMHPNAYDKARSIIESQNSEILDKAFEGKEIPKPNKESSKAQIDAIIKFAADNGINGTPTMVLSDGKVQVGGRDAEGLKKMLEGK